MVHLPSKSHGQKGFIDLASLIVLVVLLVGTAVTTYLAQQPQDTRSRASEADMGGGPYATAPPVQTITPSPEPTTPPTVSPTEVPTITPEPTITTAPTETPVPTSPPATDYASCVEQILPGPGRRIAEEECRETYPEPTPIPTEIPTVPPTSAPTTTPVPTSPPATDYDSCVAQILPGPGRRIAEEECREAYSAPTEIPTEAPTTAPTSAPTTTPLPTSPPATDYNSCVAQIPPGFGSRAAKEQCREDFSPTSAPTSAPTTTPEPTSPPATDYDSCVAQIPPGFGRLIGYEDCREAYPAPTAVPTEYPKVTPTPTVPFIYPSPPVYYCEVGYIHRGNGVCVNYSDGSTYDSPKYPKVTPTPKQLATLNIYPTPTPIIQTTNPSANIMNYTPAQQQAIANYISWCRENPVECEQKYENDLKQDRQNTDLANKAIIISGVAIPVILLGPAVVSTAAPFITTGGIPGAYVYGSNLLAGAPGYVQGGLTVAGMASVAHACQNPTSSDCQAAITGIQVAQATEQAASRALRQYQKESTNGTLPFDESSFEALYGPLYDYGALQAQLARSQTDLKAGKVTTQAALDYAIHDRAGSFTQATLANRYVDPTRSDMSQVMNKYFAELGRPNVQIVDVAGSKGTAYARLRGSLSDRYQVTGASFDLSPELLGKANTPQAAANAANLPLRSNSADVVIRANVDQYYSKYPKALETLRDESARVVKQGGLVVSGSDSYTPGRKLEYFIKKGDILVPYSP